MVGAWLGEWASVTVANALPWLKMAKERSQQPLKLSHPSKPLPNN